MPKRTDIRSILLLGAGPIVIGQACEFDYSGTQACRALREEGYRVILVNSNPATIMTDPSLADATYIEPLNWLTVAEIIAKERPDALLPTMGGQTALNCALDLAKHGVLDEFNVELIGAKREAIDMAEDRDLFRKAMTEIGLAVPKSAIAHNVEQACEIQQELGFPTIIRPSFTLGGSGGGIAYNREEFVEICEHGLELSPVHELLIEESVLGWKEYEMEVVRDSQDNCIIVCSIENLDPMGVHTGDSITVAPAQTLTDKEYQIMRNASIAVLRKIGVDTGGSNVQFAVNPQDGRLIVIEMNPRVSRSSALASKATGFPIAKVAAKLAVGYTLDELRNEITGGQTPCSFEPTIDYVVTKLPRFNFEKFPRANDKLTTQMKSVGEVMAMGRCFQESLQKAIRGLEIGSFGLDERVDPQHPETEDKLRRELSLPGAHRLWYVADAFRYGFSFAKIHQLTHIDPWFLAQIEDLVQRENDLRHLALADLSKEQLFSYKRLGFSDHRLAQLLNCSEQQFRDYRHQLEVRPVYKHVDTCGAEFSTNTSYLYSCYDEENEATPSSNKKIMILGGGPNRIGQGIEFDYCCVHGALALRAAGYETIMVNCNPETVSTDFDISDKLYFEPLTLEDVLEVVSLEKPTGVIVHYGGQTPLKLAQGLEQAGVPIIGTSPDAIDRAEDRERFQKMITELKINQPANGTVRCEEDALILAKKIGYPILVRPSYVLGGRAMKVVYSDEGLVDYLIHEKKSLENGPILLDKFIAAATEVDIDAVCDGQQVLIGGVMEHIEQAGIHSGDSSCSLPPFSLSDRMQQQLRDAIRAMALELGVVGLINAQFAIKDDQFYILEVNPRASRTVPFVSKATGVPLAKIATLCMLGISLVEQGVTDEVIPDFYSVKFPVFPFDKFPGEDPVLGPEMKSTGESMGIGDNFGEAYAKGQLGANMDMPFCGTAFLSVRDEDKPEAVEVAQALLKAGFDIVATHGTARYLLQHEIPCRGINKVREGRPHIVDMIKNNQISYIINTIDGRSAVKDSYAIRKNAVQHKIPYSTTLAGGSAVSYALHHRNQRDVRCLQDLQETIK